jgi:hypothetical protein
MTEEPFKLVCHCGFESHDAAAFVDHLLATRHIDVGEATEDGSVAELVEIFKTIQASGANPDAPLPEGMEARAISREDILSDDDMSEEEKHALLARLDAVHDLANKQKG